MKTSSLLLRRQCAAFRFCPVTTALRRARLLIVAASFAGPTLSAAQAGDECKIKGTIVDPSGALVPEASVTVLHLDNRSTRSSQHGEFELLVPCEAVTIEFKAEGFDIERRSITNIPGRPSRLVVRLSVASTLVSIDVPASNFAPGTDSTVYEGTSLDMLSEDANVFRSQLEALTGGNDPNHPLTYYVNGLRSDSPPPKSSIQSLRISSDPFSAQFASYGLKRVEIMTTVGSNKLHGSAGISVTGSLVNSRNPFVNSAEGTYALLYSSMSLSGSLNRRTGFSLSNDLDSIGDVAAINAVVLNSSLAPVTYSAAVPLPTFDRDSSGELDRKLNNGDTLSVRLKQSSVNEENHGVGQLVLVSQGYSASSNDFTGQISENHSWHKRYNLDSRLQYSLLSVKNIANSSLPSINVLGGFMGGGGSVQSSTSRRSYVDGSEVASAAFAKVLVSAGGEYRIGHYASTDFSGYNSAYVFSDTRSYAATLAELANSNTPPFISGGGPALYTATAGQPKADVSTTYAGAFLASQWQPSAIISFSGGLRLEHQTALPHGFGIAPRMSGTVVLRRAQKSTNIATVRWGIGVFHDQFPISDLLLSVREDGSHVAQYVESAPDFFSPTKPAPVAIPMSQLTTYTLSPNLRPAYELLASLGVERQLGKRVTSTSTVYFGRGLYRYLSIVSQQPLGNSNFPRYLFSSEGSSGGVSFNENLGFSFGAHLSGFVSYVEQRNHTDAEGPQYFTSDSTHPKLDNGRASGVPNRSLYLGLNGTFKHGVSYTVLLVTQAGLPYDVTTGTDLNGDTQFNDRPAYYEPHPGSTPVYTSFGLLDVTPDSSEKIIPRNIGTGPDFAWLQLSVGKSWNLRRLPVAPAADVSQHERFSPRVKVSLEVDNPTNRINAGPPVGVLSSPLFQKSLTLSTAFQPITAANRIVKIKASFSF